MKTLSSLTLIEKILIVDTASIDLCRWGKVLRHNSKRNFSINAVLSESKVLSIGFLCYSFEEGKWKTRLGKSLFKV
jgi:hypothetical protein